MAKESTIKWRQSAKRIVQAFPHRHHMPSSDLCAKSVHSVFYNQGMSMNIQGENSTYHFRMQSDSEHTLG